MKIIGLTGTIGSGKSTIARILKHYPDIEVIEADKISEEVLLPTKPAYVHTLKHFGPSILEKPKPGDSSKRAPRKIDRKKLAKIVFVQKKSLKELKSATQMWIVLDCLLKIIKYFILVKRCCVLEVPLLIESGLHKMVGTVILVTADKDVVIKRISKRNPGDDTMVKRLDFQLPQEEKIKYADLVIHNDGSLELLEERISRISHIFKESLSITLALWLVGVLPAIMLGLFLLQIKYIALFYCSLIQPKFIRSY